MYWSGGTHQCLQTYQVRHKCDKWCERDEAKVNISVCSLKRKVKVTEICVGREELINVNKLTKFDLCIINSLWETKLNANCWCRTDRRTDGFRQFKDRTCFAIWSIKNNKKCMRNTHAQGTNKVHLWQKCQ